MIRPLLDSIGTLVRNPGARKSAAVARAARRGVYAYRRDNPDAPCHHCGRDDRPRDIHHVLPVAMFPEYAEDTGNMVPLCADECHSVVGHCGGRYGSAFAPGLADKFRPLVYVFITDGVM